MTKGLKGTGIAVLIALHFSSFCQSDQPNLVLNPGFEQYSSSPLGWFYTGKDFSRVVKYWESPTAASPDVYGPNAFVPSDWRRQGFGDSKPKSGKSMVGITVYGCDGGKPHCREYIQIQLTEPLVQDQRYSVSFWTKHLPQSVRIRNLGVAFSEKRNSINLDDLLPLEATVAPGHVLKDDKGNWQEVKAEFVASEEGQYLVIGNFYSDSDTESEDCEGASALPFGYYYIDDVSLRKLPPILPIPVRENDLTKAVLETGRTIRLDNIYFEYDRDDFLPRSYQELGTLVQIMKDNPTMRIEVRGHTDNTGDTDYNNTLSLSRARAVVDYLIDHGVPSRRLQSRGYGSKDPIATNTTEEGRQQNRRVEFLILSK